ncbi:hypothetical protein H6G27_23140 [Nostoc linckia FACHB-104]|nr:hypothetical protein [Nostoc linckia FACHB-104]
MFKTIMKKNLFQSASFSFIGINTIVSLLLCMAMPTKAEPAGCGSGSTYYLLNYAIFPIASRQFRVACIEHDQCYDTYGKPKSECDKAFHQRMLGICARDHNTIIGTPLRKACNARADIFYTGVIELGQSFYDNAQRAARPSITYPSIGYFDNGATAFYSDGNTHCGFVSGTHLSFYQKVIVAPNLGRQNPNNFGNYTGACVMPKGYFENEGTVFYSAGNGSFCGFPNGETFNSHRRARPQETVWGRLDVAPSKFLAYTGVCQ